MYILGLNEALGASAAILKNGKITAAASEERFSRIKNCWGFPKQAISFCIDVTGIKTSNIDCVVLSYKDPYPHFVQNRAEERRELAPNMLRRLRNTAPMVEYYMPFLNRITDLGRQIYYHQYYPHLKRLQYEEISRMLHIPINKIVSVDHHEIHAYTAYYANPFWSANPTLVLTCDGAGDDISATIYIVRKGNFKRIAHTPHIYSLGLFYAAITGHLGLKAHEDEYKVMGLASYVRKDDVTKLLKVFEKLMWVDGLTFKSSVPARQYGLFLKEKLTGYRFDHIAAAAQIYFEAQLVSWVNNSINETGIKQIACGGGVFLNVKANSKLLARIKTKNIFFMPSPGDDTNAIGAAYYGYKLLSSQLPQTLSSLYLGPEYTESEIMKALIKYQELKIDKPENINLEVAKLLAKGEVVARFAGRMEFGVRALGNRSIMADPRNRDVVENLNKMIKMRDFWMPFAPTILAETADKYLVNAHKIEAPYMIMAFDTKEAGKRDLAAALHPYDKSVRPQILSKYDNPEFYDLISHFMKLTGVGALLNTSFNIHGEPIVESPQDAIYVLRKSSLRYLSLNNFLVHKK